MNTIWGCQEQGLSGEGRHQQKHIMVTIHIPLPTSPLLDHNTNGEKNLGSLYLLPASQARDLTEEGCLGKTLPREHWTPGVFIKNQIHSSICRLKRLDNPLKYSWTQTRQANGWIVTNLLRSRQKEKQTIWVKIVKVQAGRLKMSELSWKAGFHQTDAVVINAQQMELPSGWIHLSGQSKKSSFKFS